MSKHGLTPEQLGILRSILAPYASHIDAVGLFGSRAAGTARGNSDIDMVIYGTLDKTMVDRLWTSFDESALSLKVDIHVYDLITYPPLKVHIDAAMLPLFSKQDLL